MCLEQYITGPNSEPNKCCPHIPKLLLQNTFQYYPSIKGYDFQKVSSLEECIKKFKRYVAPTI